jgi:hypothetical protein
MVTHSERLNYLGSRFKAKDGEAVVLTLREGDEITDTLDIDLACPQHQVAEELFPDGLILRTEIMDWLIDKADLGALFPPRPGMFITRTGTGEVYQVTALGDTEPCWRYVTSQHNRVRIHTKLVDREGDVSDSQVHLTADDVHIVIDEEFLPP